MRRSHFPDPGRVRPPHPESLEAVDPALASLLGHAKRTLTEAPRAEVAAAHVAQITEAARGIRDGSAPRQDLIAPRPSPWRPLRRVAVTFAVALLAASTSMVGLAYAGVRLPSAILTAFRDVGIHLPNQSQGHAPGTPSSSSHHGQEVKTVATSGPHGCVHGRAVSAVAGANRQDAHADAHRQNAGHQTADPCAQANRQQSGGSGQTQSGSTGTSTGGGQGGGSSTTGTTNTNSNSNGPGSGTGSQGGTIHGQGKHVGADRGLGSAHAGRTNSSGSRGSERSGKSGHS